MWVAARRLTTMLAGTAYETGVVGLSAGCVMVQQLVFTLFPVFTLPVCFADFTYATTDTKWVSRERCFHENESSG